jgi:hypothetical protein
VKVGSKVEVAGSAGSSRNVVLGCGGERERRPPSSGAGAALGFLLVPWRRHIC